MRLIGLLILTMRNFCTYFAVLFVLICGTFSRPNTFSKCKYAFTFATQTLLSVIVLTTIQNKNVNNNNI